MIEYQRLSLLSVYLPLDHNRGGWVAEFARPKPRYDPTKSNSDSFTIERIPVGEINQDLFELRGIIREAKLRGKELPKDIVENFNSLRDIVEQIPNKVYKHSERIIPKQYLSF